ncbi:MAG: nucleoside kinase [Culturomica sp.]|jgi:uridine kinase|nr:nucleoside kinase [Culturomica sp.]
MKSLSQEKQKTINNKSVNTVRVFCENTEKYYDVEIGSNLLQFRNLIYGDDNRQILGALVNNQLKDLQMPIVEAMNINFIQIGSLDGFSVYIRSLIFILYKAIHDLYANKTLRIEYQISNGILCSIIGNKRLSLNSDMVDSIKKRMKEIIDADIPIVRVEIPTEHAIKLFKKQGLKDKSDLMETRGRVYTSVYCIDKTVDYFYGTLAPSTGCMNVFNLVTYKEGMLLQYPTRSNPYTVAPKIAQPKLFHIFSENKNWGKIMGISDIGKMNKIVENKNSSDIIRVSEALHEKKISIIADKINARRKNVKIILIAGPSSSGKTTFGKRLGVQLMVNGMQPYNLSLDNYFVDRTETPKNADGEYDFESIDALDLQTFKSDIERLLKGEEIEITKFSFETGERFYDGERMKLKRNGVLIIEGIHGLNPKLTQLLPADSFFRIFISALTSIAIDNHNIINPTDNRLIRRMVRDYKYRGYSALETIKRWESVLLGEEQHIVPYQEEADVMFNSALIYELGALKEQALPLLMEVMPQNPEHSKALRLLKFFSYVRTMPTRDIPNNSILREFLGGSSFKY